MSAGYRWNICERNNISEHDATLFKQNGRHIHASMHKSDEEKIQETDRLEIAVRSTILTLEAVLQQLKQFFPEYEPGQKRKVSMEN